MFAWCGTEMLSENFNARLLLNAFSFNLGGAPGGGGGGGGAGEAKMSAKLSRGLKIHHPPELQRLTAQVSLA